LYVMTDKGNKYGLSFKGARLHNSQLCAVIIQRVTQSVRLLYKKDGIIN